MSEGQNFKFGGFAADLRNSWDRLTFETRDKPELLENLESFLNGEYVRGDKEQTEFCYR